MSDEKSAQRAAIATEHFANYQEYNKVLRTWFVTFGLGGPALFLVNKNIGETFHAYPHHIRIVTYFLFGVAVQIVVALLNKFSAWHCYDDYRQATNRETRRHRFCRWLVEQFWIDILADLATAFAFLYATIAIVRIYA